ncbi:MAG: S-layer homology domain-containing protein, partial [Clostridia bacterium]|nr:S-layer homology domain-containing protein [Clostridia bacterium]
TEMKVEIPSVNKETTIKIASGVNLPKIKVVKANQLTLEIPEGTSYQTDNEVLQLPKLIEDTEAITAAIEDLEGSSKDISNVVAISVGGENSVTFGDYVMMTLNGQSGKECVFIDESGVAQPIKKVSKNAASTETGDQYCYDDGSNLIIKTKHFTEFVTYEAKTNDGGGNGGGSNDSYSWDKDGDYSVDIDVLQEHENSSSMARPFFETRNLPVEIDDGKITLAIKVNKDGNMNGYKYTDVIEEFYQKINGKYKKLNLKYLNDDDVRYITTEIEFDDPDEEAFIRVHITPMLPSTPALRIKLKKNTLGDEDDAIDLEPDEGDKQTNIKGQEIISGAITIRKNAKDLKFVNGYKDKTFRPDDNINRAEVLSMLDKITELADDVDKKDVNFKDMDMWAKESIEKFAQGGIIEGYQDGTIKPNGEMTRAEFSKIIAMVMGLEVKDEGGKLNDINDHWAKKYINALVEKGYMKGYQDKTFKPNNKITRAEVVTVINRIIGSSAQDYMVNNNPFTDIDASHWAYKDVMKAVNE